MEAMARQEGVEAVFLCAGLAHSLRPGPVRWQRLRHGPAHEAGRRFTLVDSRPISPSHHSFGDPAQLSHPETEAAFARFLRAEGPFDIVHFNNLEGLPAAVLALRAQLPDTRFVVSLHNYYPFCPQVNLWHREDHHCDDFEGGRACTTCLPFRPDPRQVRLANAAAHTLDGVGLRPGVAAFDRGVQPAMRVAARAVKGVAARRRRARGGPTPTAPVTDAPTTLPQGPPPAATPAAFAERRAEIVRLINAHADRVLAVSARTADIALDFGIRPKSLEVQRIGTSHAGRWTRIAPPARLPVREDGTLKLAYLGYMRRDKGFYFLLDALEGLPAALKRRLHVLVAARAREPESPARLGAMAADFASIEHREGYTRADLDDLLADVDLGVVPVLWEDNLPQVALEMHARRIPLLTSDRGGARELAPCSALSFPAGDAAAFAQRLGALVETGLDLTDYWSCALAPTTPAAHVKALLRLYEGLTSMGRPNRLPKN
ncbi:MAG: glycosyltransferase [Pseudomonadota bacterium]